MREEEKVEAVQQPPAFTLEAANATGGPSVTKVSWDELFGAERGDQWNVTGSGALFSESVCATLMYVDDKRALVFFEYFSSESINNPRIEARAFYR